MAFASVAAVGPSPAAQPGVRMSFDIPAQPLQEALEQFMTATAYSGLYDSTLMAGLYSTPVKGVMAPEAALRQLVANSGLVVRYAAGDTFTIAPGPAIAPPQANAAQSPRQDAKARYFGAVQASIRDVFCRNPSTVPGTYRLALSLWVKPSGAVEKVRLLDSSGSDERDARITAGLRSLRLPALPSAAGIRQPITMVVLPTPPGAQENCVG